MKKTLAVITLAGSLAFMGAVPAMAYPDRAPGITVDDGSVGVGDTIVVTGTGYVPGETVTVTVLQGNGNAAAGGGQYKDTYTVTADGNGEFTLSLSISKPGAYTVTAQGAGGKTSSTTVKVTGAATAGLANTGGVALANTGASPDLVLWSLVGAGALVAGTTSVIVVRRRAKAEAAA